MSRHIPPFKAICPKCGAIFDEVPDAQTGEWRLGWQGADAEACQEKPISQCPALKEATQEYCGG